MLEARTVYTHPDAKGVELWATPEGLSVRNGKRGKPLIVDTVVLELEEGMNVSDPHAIEEHIAEAFFAGLTYHA
jgi:L-aminopeptidase/D-esterase-like protein